EENEALKKALSDGEVSVIEELLNSGVSVEAQLSFGWSPLMYAASLAHFTIVQLLLDRGANVSFEIDKYTVLMAACVSQASEDNILKTVELLLSRNADPNATCRRQMTALMYAARKGYPRVVALLVARGSRVNAQDVDGYSALMWAAQQGHKRVLLKLLELGADKDLRAKDKRTAADLAKANKHLEICSFLSLAENHLQGRHQETTNQEAIYKFLTAAPDCQAGSYSTFDVMETFLHGLGLEHIAGLLKEKEITLRQLLMMQKDELTKVGIKDPGDQQKLLDTVKELQVEELSIDELSEVLKVELSGDEFLKFLQKLNKECSKLIVPVQTVSKHLLQNSHKVVLQWAPPARFAELCEALLCSVEQLREEVTKMKGLL
ncbi:ASZ1 protein, partial [Bucco capensis]|nr:ASZ1 protein [Bucco capensis]